MMRGRERNGLLRSRENGLRWLIRVDGLCSSGGMEDRNGMIGEVAMRLGLSKDIFDNVVFPVGPFGLIPRPS